MFKLNFYAAFDESMLLSTDGSFGTLESDFFAGSSLRPVENFWNEPAFDGSRSSSYELSSPSKAPMFLWPSS
jgi:hypothetical protein